MARPDHASEALLEGTLASYSADVIPMPVDAGVGNAYSVTLTKPDGSTATREGLTEFEAYAAAWFALFATWPPSDEGHVTDLVRAYLTWEDILNGSETLRGQSAYEQYVAAGGLLTLEEWLEAGFSVELGTAALRDMMTEGGGPLALFASDSAGTAPFGTITGRTWDNELGGDQVLTWGAPEGAGTGSWRNVAVTTEPGSVGPPGIFRRNTGGSGVVFQGVDLGEADGQFKARWGTVAGARFYLCARYDAATDSFYAASLSSSGANVQIARRHAGVEVALGPTHAVAVLDDVAIACNGSTISLLINDVVVESITDTAIPGGTKWGFRDNGTNATFAWSDVSIYTHTTAPVPGPVPNKAYVDEQIEEAIGDQPASQASTLDDLLGPEHDPIPVAEPGNPMVVGSTVTFDGVYEPWLVRLADHLTEGERSSLGLGEWGIYYSTDHQSAGGIALLTGPIDGPWVDKGQVYVDAVDGDSTETPAVMYVEGDDKPWWMYYQQRGVSSAVGAQSTLLVRSTSPLFTSPDRHGVVLDLPNLTEFVGTGHTGYFRPFRVGGQWYGYSLIGTSPTKMPSYALWASVDGITWTIHPWLIEGTSDLVPAGWDVAWNSSEVFRCRGQLWWVGRIRSAVGGGPTPGNVTSVAIAPIAPTLRHLIGPPRVVLDGDDAEGWLGADIRSCSTAVHAGRMYVVYGDGIDLGLAVTEVL